MIANYKKIPYHNIKNIEWDKKHDQYGNTLYIETYNIKKLKNHKVRFISDKQKKIIDRNIRYHIKKKDKND